MVQIEVEEKTIELLDVIKKYNPESDYNKVLLFLILNYGERLQEKYPETLELLNKTKEEDDEEETE